MRRGVLVLVALLGCADLSRIAEGVCGNRVVDPGEDCDVLVDDRLGADLACSGCRYVCVASACPDGWGCGTDGTCRQPSTELAPGPSVPGWAPSSLQVVDVDGDGLLDLAGKFDDRLEVRARDASGGFVPLLAAVDLQVTGDVAAGDLDGHPPGDVILPTRPGLQLWRGQTDGPPLQVAFAGIAVNNTSLRVVPLRAPDLGPEGLILALFASGDDVVAAIVEFSDGRTQTARLVAAGHAVEELDGRMAVADLDGDGGDEIAFALPGDDAVLVATVGKIPLSEDRGIRGLGDDPDAPPTRIDVGEVRLCSGCVGTRGGLRVAGGLRFADVDADLRPDLLVDVAAEALPAGGVVVIPGVEGGFGAPHLDPRFEALASADVVDGLASGVRSAWPIAAGDLDGDGWADFVGADGVFMTVPPDGDAPLSLAPPQPRDWAEPWTAASIDDLDGDGTLDVAAIARGARAVHVLLCGTGELGCAETGALKRLPYPTSMGVTQVRTGSLQGLAAHDIVLIESPPEGSEDDDAITVLLGQPGEGPAPPERRARLRRIESLEVAPAGFPGVPTVDLFEDIQIVARRPNGKASYGVLYADGFGQLRSPLTLAPGFATPHHALIGRFARAEGGSGLVVVGEGPGVTIGAWYFPAEEGAAFSALEVGTSLRDVLPHRGLDCARFAVGDLEGDGLDEIVVLTGGAVCGSTEPTRLAVGRVGEGAPDSAGVLRFEAIDLGEDLPPAAQMLVTDLDGDGDGDVLIAGTGAVHILPGGTPALAGDPLRLELPPGEDVLGIAALSEPPGAERVAILTSASLLLANQDRILATRSADGARRVASGDVDADGIADVVLVGDDGVRVLLATTAPPLGGSR